MTGKKRILIVDDDIFMRETTSDILREKGYDVDWATSGEETVQKMHEKHFDVVLLDLKLGGMNGCETHQAIKKINALTKTIIITGYSQDEVIKDCLRDGVFGILYKPLDMDKVIAHIELAGKGTIVMIIEDDEIMRHSLENILREHGYYVIGAKDSEEALQKAIEIPPHILITDIKLPTLNGCDIFIAIKEIVPSVKAILITGYREEVHDLITMALEKGAHTCLYKPFDAEHLLKILKEIT